MRLPLVSGHQPVQGKCHGVADTALLTLIALQPISGPPDQRARPERRWSATIEKRESTIVISPGWCATVDRTVCIMAVKG
jgi:hypothetical protein